MNPEQTDLLRGTLCTFHGNEGPLLEALLEVAALALLVWVWLAPKVEKFQPDCERSNVTLGWSIVKPVT